jgi:uncharacterized membrane protein YphA (DoxX/SURF4 family)
MASLLRNPWPVRLCQLAIGAYFILAALGKIGDLGSFALQVHNFRIVPVWSENLVAMWLPWVELLAGLALVLGVRARSGALVTFVLLVAFTAGVGLAMARGLDFECGCFGTSDHTRVGAFKLLQNIVWTVIAWLALRPTRLDTAST